MIHVLIGSVYPSHQGSSPPDCDPLSPQCLQAHQGLVPEARAQPWPGLVLRAGHRVGTLRLLREHLEEGLQCP